LFAGRPIVWRSDGRADGLVPLDPKSYVPPAREWAASLDGSFVAARYDPASGLEVVTSPMGSYPVFAAQSGTRRWVSNRAALLASLLPRTEQDQVAVAQFLATGWPLGGRTLWQGVRQLERGSIHRFGEQGDSVEELPGVDVRSLLASCGSGLDRERAAADLVESVRAAAEWPARPNVVFLSGGLDSRVVLAGAVESGIEFEARTVADPGLLGYPETGDVVVARGLAAMCSVPHTVVSTGSVEEEPATRARLVRLLTNGLVSLGDAGPLRVPDPGLPLDVTFSGKGGEVSRTFYGIGRTNGQNVDEQIFQHVVPRRPEPLVNDEGRNLVRSFITDWVDRHVAAGAGPEDVPDLFYTLERLPYWAAPSHMFFEQKNDTVTPLWFARVVPHQLAPSAGEREQELFHFHVLSQLSPPLASTDFDGTNPSWPVFGKNKATRRHAAEVVLRKATRELRRRARSRLQRSRDNDEDPFVKTMAEVRRSAAAHVDHPAWRYLDRARVERLLNTHPLQLDPRSRRLAWRLASVLLVEERP
jgi:hypothetical protein